jgi:glutathione S-transferase
MDKLYAASGSTSLVAAILLEECEHPYTLEMMALNPDGAGDAAYAQVNPWRQVPAIETPHGIVTEVIAIAQYLDHVHPERELFPTDPWQRTQAMRWYSCLSTAIQPYIRCIVRPERFVGDDAACGRLLREHVAAQILDKLQLVNDEIAQRNWLAGDDFGPADALLVTIVGWARWMQLPLAPLGHLQSQAARCRARPAFERAATRHGIKPNIVKAPRDVCATPRPKRAKHRGSLAIGRCVPRPFQLSWS